MAKEIYLRPDGEKNTVTDVMEVSDDVSFLILQIEMLLGTRKKDILGSEQVGINLEDLIFSLNQNEIQIKNEIISQIYSHCPLTQLFPVSCDVVFFKTQQRDIAIVDILIDGRKSISIFL